MSLCSMNYRRPLTKSRVGDGYGERPRTKKKADTKIQSEPPRKREAEDMQDHDRDQTEKPRGQKRGDPVLQHEKHMYHTTFLPLMVHSVQYVILRAVLAGELSIRTAILAIQQCADSEMAMEKDDQQKRRQRPIIKSKSKAKNEKEYKTKVPK